MYEDGKGHCPVAGFIDSLDEPRQAKVLAVIELLKRHGPTLPHPYSSQLRGKLRELRTQHGRDKYRVLYFGAPDRTFVLLHAFRRRAEKTPAREIEIAEGRMADYLKQGDEP